MTEIRQILEAQFAEAGASNGLSTLNLLNLPSKVTAVIRLLMRHKEMSYVALCEAVEAMPEQKRLSTVELGELLEVLCKYDWLIETQQEGQRFYEVNLRPAVASATGKTQQSRSTQQQVDRLWAKAGLDEAPAKNEPPTSEQPALPAPQHNWFKQLLDRLFKRS